MRTLMAAAAAALTLAFSSAVSAQPIVTPDPGRYAGELANNMAVGGIAPLRSLYGEMYQGAALPSNIEAALLTYERGLPSSRAVLSRVVEDVTLADTFRSIYLYHYYGANAWVFVRLDFVRIDPGGDWALSAASFASEWSGVAQSLTPGFRAR